MEKNVQYPKPDFDSFKDGFKKLPLGLKLNNLGCLRTSKSKWIGLVGSKNGFCEFASIEDGIRALTIVLCKYVFSYHLFQIYDIANRYAPQADGNDPKVYADYLKKKSGFEILSTNIHFLKIQLPLLVYAITCIELGKEYEIKSNDTVFFTRYFFSVVDKAFDEYLGEVYYPVYGVVPNIYL